MQNNKIKINNAKDKCFQLIKITKFQIFKTLMNLINSTSMHDVLLSAMLEDKYNQDLKLSKIKSLKLPKTSLLLLSKKIKE